MKIRESKTPPSPYNQRIDRYMRSRKVYSANFPEFCLRLAQNIHRPRSHFWQNQVGYHVWMSRQKANYTHAAFWCIAAPLLMFSPVFLGPKVFAINMAGLAFCVGQEYFKFRFLRGGSQPENKRTNKRLWKSEDAPDISKLEERQKVKSPFKSKKQGPPSLPLCLQ